MAKQIYSTLNFNGGAGVTGLPMPTTDDAAAPKGYVDSVIEGLAWKDDVRCAPPANVNLASPGATLDGLAMAVGDRVLLRNQTDAKQNGIYVWNGATTAMGRSPDASTGDELTNAVVSVNEGTDAGTSWRCTSVKPALGTDPVAFGPFVAGAPPASETTEGVARIATQAEVDGGDDDETIVTPKKLATWAGRLRKIAAPLGDGSATQYDITHGLGSRDVHVAVYRTSSPYDEVIADVQRLDTNTVRVLFAAAPSANQFRCVVIG